MPIFYLFINDGKGAFKIEEEKKISWTTMDEVRNRTKQAVKKGKVLLFHWRGGYLTREILAELLEIFDKEARAKDKRASVSVNWPQAVLRVRFEDGVGEEQLEMEDANERDECSLGWH